MEANELRIGNMLHFPFTNENIEVLGINAHEENFKIINSISFKKESNLYCEKISVLKAIPLTEEWLLKFGFKEDETYVSEENPYEDYIKDEVRISMPYFSFNYGDGGIMEFKYVHQLQNLYLALTGTELTLNNK